MRSMRWIAILACFAWTQGAWAQQKSGANSAPTMTAEQVLEKAETAFKNADKIKGVKKGTISISPVNIKGTFVEYTKAPNKSLSIQNISGVGETKVGFDGKVYWSQDPLTGLRTLGKDELGDADMDPSAIAKSLDKNGKLEMLGIQQVEGHDAYLVRATRKTGKPIDMYVDTKTFLPVRMDLTMSGPQGTFPTQIYLSDYRLFGGSQIPYLVRAKISTIATMEMKTTEIKQDANLDDKMFVKPESSASSGGGPGK